MAREENDRLIIDDDYGRAKKFSKTKILVCCCMFILLFIFGVIAASVLMKKSKPQWKKKPNSTSDLNDLDLTKFGLPQNLSDLLKDNENLCSRVSNEEADNNSNNPSHVYIIKTKPNLTDEEACGVESVLRLLPDKTVYLIDFTKPGKLTYDKCSTPPNYLGLLLYLYKDRMEMVFADRKEFFKSTPLQNVSKSEDKIEFLAVVLTAYKYGGLVTTPGMVLSSRELVECLPEETIVEPFAVLTSKKCDDFLHYLMQTVSLCGSTYQPSLEEMLDDVVQLYTKGAASGGTVRRLGPLEVCETPAESCSFVKLREFKSNDPKWVCELSTFCKQVVQAFLGIKINQMEVEEETSKIKSDIKEKKKLCKPRKKLVTSHTCDD